jgi:hypothetical protein
MPSGIGYGAGVGLEEVLARLFMEAQANQKARADDRRADLDQQEMDLARQRFQAEDDARRNPPREGVILRPGDLLADKRTGGTLAERQAAPEYVTTPDGTVVEAGTWRPVFQMPPKPAPPLVLKDGDTLFDMQARQPIYTAPRRTLTGRLSKIDPSFPPDVQAAIVGLRSQHPTFEQALPDFGGHLEQWRQQFPELSADKAMTALRQAYAGGGSQPSVDDIIAQVLSQGPAASTGGGRGAAPPARPAGDDATLQAAAAQVLTQAGYPATPDNVRRFLANPANRQRLAQRAGAADGR